MSLFSYASIEERIPAKYPLRQIRLLANEALKGLDRTLDELYASSGHPSIPPEQLLLTLLLKPSTACAPSRSCWSNCTAT